MSTRNKYVPLFVSFIVTSLICLTTFSLAQNALPQEFTDSATIQFNDTTIQVRVETDETTYLLGEVVKISIFLKNIGNKPLALGGISFSYAVKDSTGKYVYGGIYGGIGVFADYPSDFTLMPQGETKVIDFWWRQETNNKVQVPPGTYIVEVRSGSPFKVTLGTQIKLIKG